MLPLQNGRRRIAHVRNHAELAKSSHYRIESQIRLRANTVAYHLRPGVLSQMGLAKKLQKQDEVLVLAISELRNQRQMFKLHI